MLVAVLVVVVAVLVASIGVGLGRKAPRAGTATDPARGFSPGAPNFVIVMTDDQALDTMRALPKTRKLIGGDGVTFSSAVASFPLCCPSRATFLTGAYAHNHGVIDNSGEDGGLDDLDQSRTLPVWLSKAGYRTAFIGKYLNGYSKKRTGGPRFIPPGWNQWFAFTKGASASYDYKANDNGKIVEFGSRTRDYKTDVLSDRATDFINEFAPRPRPFFLWVATNAPHKDVSVSDGARRNPLPAPRHEGKYENVGLPGDPGFNEADVADKPRVIRHRGRVGSSVRKRMRQIYESQLESLAAVDELVEGVVIALREAGELDRTLVVFTTDHGVMRGQHRVRFGKSWLYEPAIRTPLLVRGPGFRGGLETENLVANVDLAPTILELAGARADRPLDGLPLQQAMGREGRRRHVLLEVFERKDGGFRAVRTMRWVFAKRETGERELYDLERDPHQLENLAGSRRYRDVERRLAGRLADLAECAGADCR